MSRNCSDCTNSNPASPVYSQAAPLSQPNCFECGQPGVNFYTPPEGFGGKTTEILDGFRTTVEDLSDSFVDRFKINYSPYTPLEVALTLEAYAGAVLKANPVLVGTVITRAYLTWGYNKVILTQTLTNNGGLTPPTLGPADDEHDYTGLTLNSNTSFTIQGNDGEGESGSIAADTESITYGNYRIIGVGPRQTGKTLNDLETFIESLIASPDTELATTQVKNFFGQGETLEHMFFAHPTSWGYSQFFKNASPGGWVRLVNDGGTIITADPAVGAVAGESDIVIDNGVGTDTYYVYQSYNDNIEDTVTQTECKKL